MSITLSVIIPVYNAVNTIKHCIDSVFNQSFKSFELILVDDGSTDGSGEICDSYQNENDHVTVIHKINGGVSSARNAGLEIARGDYVTFIDSDDQLQSDFFENGIKKLLQYSAGIYFGGFIRIDYLGESISTLDKEIYGYVKELKEDDIVALLERNYIASCCAKLYSKELIGQCQFDTNMMFGEDLKFVFDILKKDPFVIADTKPFYKYVSTDNSLTSRTNYKKCLNVLETYEILYQFGQMSNYLHKGQYFNYIDERWRNDFLTMEKIILNDKSSIFSKYRRIKLLCSSKLLITRFKNSNNTYITNYAIKPLKLIISYLINQIRRH